MDFQGHMRSVGAVIVGALCCLGTYPASAADASNSVYEFARAERADLTSNRDGQWQTVGAFEQWTLDLDSSGASSLSLHLSALELPPGAVLAVLAPGDGTVSGQYTALDISATAQLWTAMVPGDALRLRVLTPAGTRPDVRVQVAHLYHGLREARAKAQSGACQVSSSCPTAAGWADAARSVAMITIGGTRQCSATLLNNTRSDGDPLLLTARHCFVGGSDELPAESVVAYWSYALDSCGDGTLRVRVTQSGAELLAHDANTDATLLRLSSRPPAEANVRYAGWDASLNLTDTGVGIHHPRGDDRKVSTYTAAPRTVRALIDDFEVQSLLVNWSEGTTEPGSSGSGLFNADGLVVGQLSGGSSACDVSAGPDFYGRLDLAFSARFSSFLDPDATGLRSIDGVDASALTFASGEPAAPDADGASPPTTGLTLFGIDVGGALSDATGIDNPAGEGAVDSTEPQRPSTDNGPALGDAPAAGDEGAGSLPLGMLAIWGLAALRRRTPGAAPR